MTSAGVIESVCILDVYVAEQNARKDARAEEHKVLSKELKLTKGSRE